MQGQLFRVEQPQVTVTYTSGMCREPGCGLPARRKQGARYCAEHARSIDYGPVSTDNATFKVERECVACRRTFKRWRQTRATTITVEVCPDCIRESPLSLKQLSDHNVPPDLQRLWLSNGAELDCGLCGRRLYRKARPSIDHDHACCPGSSSCGRCVRGVVCSRCNTNLAHFERLLADVGLEKALAWIVF
jgi:hypothetical protein